MPAPVKKAIERAGIPPAIPAANFKLLEGILWEPRDGCFLLDYHIERLQRSSAHFHFPLDAGALRQQLSDFAATLPALPRKIRLALAADGIVTLSAEAVKPSTPLVAVLSSEAIDSADPIRRHKTDQREVFDRALAAHPEAHDVLLQNERHELTETCFGNLVLEIGGRKLTPPLSCGLQPGVFRAWLLDSQEIQEAVLPADSLSKASRIFMINSVRKWCPIQLLGQ